MVTTIVESNNRIKELKRRWCDVLKQNLKNVDKNKEIAVEPNTLLEKRLSNPGGRKNIKNNVIVTDVSENDDKTTIQPSNPSTQIRKKD